MSTQRDYKEIVHEILAECRLMAIATCADHPWIASVYYVSDNNLNLYFISPASSYHCKQILKNNSVACAIADSSQKARDKKVGLQLYGHATMENELATIKWMLRMYNKLYPSTKEKLNFKNFQAKIMTSKVYKVTPKMIKIFSEKHSLPDDEVILHL
ncbi:hypothetical protein A3H80_03645 [Candidatus Roizmanbacteria bacterium RIFCSPLOWO2_02_FULL_37_19]|uniref:Pyridoxamine 5'-phosphate oxidase N-terminal domain-containing protein n=1 Tax=Candidatus Roizmanbacteria bacterium RIFCSPHIGHO2_02_FULL_37_24 TaxID=1802037 RepID=A0A1F7GVU2_9BACT|nr:MAG: hypothetical protein A2862_04585 [Candidatus Roizmanbacteria bacterium RIFCSPHIGHO2_01_FULL_38_41]OGK22935.1 MAG: hypothetical protein A3C24_03695 [Candidatus Roizmanbacteria bacterium RIFCSPHIGHO2_02_FULL_37_24]OGK33611.1 MAG: hypothetical protein A3E10_05090 [Candidatus Roizmanbacteria bacterium RIFCSPHIGHO2_12_FULL_37_23]OGK44184.1 MAG: hypothetical protein A2956_00790 [Candidatus Roizmanbacteria bacterium RIFCSPLOWO2_01_FULL_37_57]OGK55263.1 MAG: hypothetical protein A3H80_03645 [Ca